MKWRTSQIHLSHSSDVSGLGWWNNDCWTPVISHKPQNCVYRSSKEPQAQEADFEMHKKRRLQQQAIKAWPRMARESAMAMASNFCSGLVGANGKVPYTLVALALQHVFLYFLWKAAGQMTWQMLETFVLDIKNVCARNIRTLLELPFWRKKSLQAVYSSPQG